jgi:hypothetical protein
MRAPRDRAPMCRPALTEPTSPARYLSCIYARLLEIALVLAFFVYTCPSHTFFGNTSNRHLGSVSLFSLIHSVSRDYTVTGLQSIRLVPLPRSHILHIALQHTCQHGRDQTRIVLLRRHEIELGRSCERRPSTHGLQV